MRTPGGVPKLLCLELSRSSLAKLAGAVTVFADASLLVDASVRWHKGYGFVNARGWLVTAIVLLVVYVGLAALPTVRWRRVGVPTVGLSFVLLCMTFITASTGSGQYEWWTAPPWDLFSSHDWYAKLHYEFGFAAAFLGTVAHWSLARVVVRQNGQAPSFAVGGELMAATGLSFASISLVSRATFVVICETTSFAEQMNGDCRHDTRVVSEAALAAITATRHVFWGAVETVGFALLAFAGILHAARLAWLSRVARGKIPGFELVALEALVDEQPVPSIRFARSPIDRPKRALVRVTPEGRAVIGTVP